MTDPIGGYAETHNICMVTTSENIENLQDKLAHMSYVLGYSYSSLNSIIELPDEQLRPKLQNLLGYVEECVNILFYSELQEEE